MIKVFMGSFCLTPNTVFPICKVKIVKTLCVGARANIGSARVDLCKQKTTSYLDCSYTYNLMQKVYVLLILLFFPEPVLKNWRQILS